MAKRLRSIPPVIPHYPPDNDRGAYAPQLWYGDEAVNAADGPWYDAPPGSIYVKGGTTTGGLYHKVADTGAASDWQGITSTVNSTAGVFNVLDYGATGDGTTDDTTAIQAALTACGNAGGGTVYFPTTADAYRCTAQITVPTRTTLLGYGATIHIDGYDDTTGTPYHQFYIDTVTENITFEGLHFLGNHVYGNAFPLAPDGHPAKAILFWHPDGSGAGRHTHVQILNCTFTDVAGYSYYIDFAEESLISSCRVMNCYGQNCNANYTRLVDNHFEQCGGFEGSGDALIIAGNSFKSPLASQSILSLGGYAVASHYNPGIIVSGNTFQDWAGASKNGVVVAESAENVQIVGNTFTNFTGDQVAAIGNYMGTAGATQRGFVIAHNSFSGFGGIGATAINLTAHTSRASDVLITGNRIGVAGGSDFHTGIYCEIADTTISQNIIYAVVNGVELNTATNVRLLDNYLSATTQVNLINSATLAAPRGALSQLGPWFQDNAAANQSAVALLLEGGNRAETVMVRAGALIGVTLYLNAVLISGSIAAEVTLDGTGTGLTATINTGVALATTTQTAGADTFTAGQRIGVKLTTSADWAATTTDLTVGVLVDLY